MHYTSTSVAFETSISSQPRKTKKKQKIELQMFQSAAGRILESDWFLFNYEFKFTIFFFVLFKYGFLNVDYLVARAFVIFVQWNGLSMKKMYTPKIV